MTANNTAWKEGKSPSTHSSISHKDKGSHCFISASTQIEGDFHTSAPMRIDGRLLGNVTCEDKLVVGPDGFIDGNIQAQSIVIHGKVIGEVQASNTLVLEKTARVEGNIRTKVLSVEGGALFTGTAQVIRQG